MRKRITLLILALILVFAVSSGLTMAYFNNYKDTRVNFKAGTVDIKLNEQFTPPSNWNPLETVEKLIDVENIGTKRVYVRVKLIGVWQKLNGTEWVDVALSPENVTLAIDPSSNMGWVFSEGFYYYKRILSPGQKTDPKLIINANLSSQDIEKYRGLRFKLKAVAESVQASNGAYRDVWKINNLPIEVEQ